MISSVAKCDRRCQRHVPDFLAKANEVCWPARHGPKDQRYQNAYVFGTVCPSRDTGVAAVFRAACEQSVAARKCTRRLPSLRR